MKQILNVKFMKFFFLLLAVGLLINLETKARIEEIRPLEYHTFNQPNLPYGPIHSRSVAAIKGFIAANKLRMDYENSLHDEIADNARAGAEALRIRDAQKIAIYRKAVVV